MAVQTWRMWRIEARSMPQRIGDLAVVVLRLLKVVKEFELEGEFGVLVVFELWKAAQFY